MNKIKERFDIGDEVKIIYPGIDVVRGELIEIIEKKLPEMYPEDTNYRAKIKTRDGETHNGLLRTTKHIDCNHELIYSKSRGYYCPFCEL